MLIVHLLFALAFAIILGAFFSIAFERRGPWESVPIFFLILFLVIWAGGIWITPIGPMLWGVYWVPFFIIGLLIALFLAAATPPPRPPHVTPETLERRQEELRPHLALETFFWTLLVGLVIVIAVRYIV
jgi:hypothetical protein